MGEKNYHRILIFLIFLGIWGGAKPSVMNPASGLPIRMKIEQARIDKNFDGLPDKIGQKVTVSGRVTVAAGVFHRSELRIFIQDGTAGIQVISKTISRNLQVGDSVLVAGKIGQNNGLAHIDAEQIIQYRGDSKTPDPVVVELTAANMESFEGQLVHFEARLLKYEKIEAGEYLMLHLQSWEVILAFRQKTQPDDLEFTRFEPGDLIAVTGILGQYDRTEPYDGNYQIYPRSPKDIEISGLSNDIKYYLVLGIGGCLLIVSFWGMLLRYKVKERTRELETQKTRLQETVDALNKARKMAEESTLMKSEFLANMSHEIRTPINGVLGMNELLLKTNLTLEQHDYAETIYSSAKSLLSLVNDILDFSKIEAGKLTLEQLPFCTGELTEQTAAIVALQVQQKKLDFVLEIDPELYGAYIGDPTRIRQIMLNLLSNAAKFTSDGEIRLRAELIDRPENGPSTIRFSIKDTGVGIPPEKKDLIFQSFSQADGSITRIYGGTGLGLSISRELAFLMGGEIGVNSEVGKGSEFWFTVKLDTPTPANFLRLPLEKLANTSVVVLTESGSTARHYQKSLSGICRKVWTFSDIHSVTKHWFPEISMAKPAIILDSDLIQNEQEAAAIFIQKIISANLPVIVMQYHHHGRNQELLESLSDRLVFIKKPISAVRITELLLFLYEQPKTNENRKLLRRCNIKNEATDETVNGDGRRVLIVEDNPVNQKLIRRLLEKKGYEITVANDGLEGIAAHESVRFDIVLMDMQMPRMDGLTATREIRQRELNSGTHVPIIALTANAMQGDREKCLQAGMDEYISKPIDTKELFKIIRRFHDSK